MSTSADTGQKGGPSPDDEYQGQISSIQQIFAEYDHNGSGKVRVERVPDLIVNLGRDLQVGREVARQLSGSGAVELTTFEEVVQTLKRVEESQDREPDSETTTPLTLLKRLNAYRKQCESNGECARGGHVKAIFRRCKVQDIWDIAWLFAGDLQQQVEAGEQPSGVVASKDDAVEHAEHNQELCSICLEGLDDCCFSYPCGQGHRLHYHCMLHFLGSILAIPLSDETPGPLRKEQVREMGTGFKAVALLEAAMQNLHVETRRRLCCPLCRCSWPDEAEVSLEQTMASLRQCRIKMLAKNVGRLEKAFNSVQASYDQRVEIGQADQRPAAQVLDNNLHTAESYLSHRDTACSTVLRIFEFLDARHVTSVSACCTAAARHCWVECKLRAPHVKAATATHHIWPQTTRSLLIDPSLRTAVQKGTSGLDVVSFSKWLACAAGLLEVNIHAAGWEKLDPGAGYLSKSLPIQHLQILDLSHNGLTDLGAQNLAAALTKKRPVRLEVLTLELNCITEAGFDSLLSLGKDVGN
ncbi:serC, partial [Symbiodinium necroappetens]